MRSATRLLQVIAAVLVAAGASVAAFLPTYTIATTDSAGRQVVRSATVLEVNGPLALLVLLLPVLVATAPLLVRDRWWTIVSFASAAVLLCFAIAGSFTIGMYFAPAAVLSVVAALLQGTRGAGEPTAGRDTPPARFARSAGIR